MLEKTPDDEDRDLEGGLMDDDDEPTIEGGTPDPNDPADEDDD
jgi:hypothetical protein